MKYFISDLIVGISHFSEFADWIDSQHQSDFGIEFTAFTHDKDYWERLSHKVPQMSCPMTFHGPYINIEATSPLRSIGAINGNEYFFDVHNKTSFELTLSHNSLPIL